MARHRSWNRRSRDFDAAAYWASRQLCEVCRVRKVRSGSICHVCRDAENGKSETERQLYEGIDDDIAELFFNLDGRSIELMFKHYERDHGRSSHEYAVKTYREWKAGTVRVSGKVADRLVAIVPHYITFDQKYELLEKTWKKQGKRRISVAVTPHQDTSVALRQIAEAVDAVSVKEFPESLKRRLTWLTASDTQIAQLLLNRLFAEERRLVLEALSREVQAVARLMRGATGSTIRSSHTFAMPGLEVCVTVAEAPAPRKSAVAGSSGQSGGWIWAAIIGGAIVLYTLCNAAQRSKIEYHSPYIPPARHRR
jgi:hypothetical protein